MRKGCTSCCAPGCGTPPQTWVEQFKAAQTISFSIKYPERETLSKAYDEFHKCNPEQDELFQSRLEAVKKMFCKPFLNVDDVSNMVNDSHIEKLIACLLEEEPTEGASTEAIDDIDSPPVLHTLKQITAHWMRLMQERVKIQIAPHPTQSITMLLFAHWYDNCIHGAEKRALLAQVGTGEGKSLIIAMLAIHFANQK